jgi:type I restriction enzyme S subunit
MGCEWATVPFNDLGEINRGRSRHRPRYAEHLYGGPYPFIQTGDIRESGGRITSHSQTYSEEGLKQSRLWPAGTMCITIAANIAETAILSYPACFPDSVVGFIADDKKCHVRFVEYTFRHIKRLIQAEASGSVQDNINLGTLSRLEIPLPPLPEQKAIAHVLGSLDDKIELNRRMNETLEGMAQALFKSWFVDFDPVIDNALAAGNPIPEPLAQRAETRRQAIANGTANRKTAQAFPASFRFTEELGWIPEGWEVSTMEDFSIEVESGKRPKGGIDKSLNDGVPSIGAESLLSIGNFEYSKLKYVQKEFADKSTKGWVKNYDVGIYKDGANVGDPSRVSLFGNGFPFEDFMVNEHVFLLRSNVIGQPFLYSLFRTEGISQQLRVMGTSKAAQPGLNQKEVLSCKFVAPNNNQFDEFNRIIFPLIDKRLFFGKESQTLAKLRDVLLPKLISGELRIPQAEKMVEEAIA